MRSYGDDDEVDFAIVGTGAVGGTLTCNPASAGFRVVAFDAGPFWRPLEDSSSTTAISSTPEPGCSRTTPTIIS
jgi:RAB protein geranylgeranyltransferase component A